MVDLHLGRLGLAELDPAAGVGVGGKGAGDDDATGAPAVLHRRQLNGEDVIAGVAAVVTTTARVVVGPGLPELVPLVSRYVRPYGEDAASAEFGRDQFGGAVAGRAVAGVRVGMEIGGGFDPAGSAPATG